MNMNNPVECIRNHTQMEAGYVAEITKSGRGYQVQHWSPRRTRVEFLDGHQGGQGSVASRPHTQVPGLWLPGILRQHTKHLDREEYHRYLPAAADRAFRRGARSRCTNSKYPDRAAPGSSTCVRNSPRTNPGVTRPSR